MAKGLGRGLSALFSDTEEAYENAQGENGGATEIALDNIFPNPDQPRKAFDENALNDLAKSIREHGVIMPLVVNRCPDGTYMIIAGERRYRAAKMAGLTAVPAVVKDYDERKIQEISLIENLQREDLNPIEAAYGMKRLMEEYSLTQEVLAERLGKSRPAIANTLRLLTLSEEVIALVRDGKISSGHARTLVPVPKEEQTALAMECVKNGWSVREMERAVKQFLNPPEVLAKEKEKKTAATSAELKYFVERLRNTFKTKVSLIGTDKKGRIYIDYYTRDDLDRISELLDILDNQE
jgi:ParB family chromosome partitioning protein